MHEESDKPLKRITPLIAFKPRQILLAEQQRRHLPVNECGTKMVNKQPQQDSNSSTGNSELKPALQKSILNYLHKNGLSKTLKRFLKEAQIESDDWKTSSADLEDIFARHAVHCQNSDVKIKGSVHEDGTGEKDVSGLCVAEEISSKKKKKKENKIEENNVNVVPANSEPTEYSKSADTDNKIVKDKETGTKIKSKEKKSKKQPDLVSQRNDNTNESIGKLKETGSINEQKDMSQKGSRSPIQSVDSNVKDTEMLPVVSEKKLASSVVTNGHDKIAEAGKTKDKKEKKKRQTVALVDDGQMEKIIIVDNNDGTDVPQEDGKAKSKKKKKAVSENNESEFIDNEESLESGAKKVSKKRKSASCNDGEEQPVEDLVNGESKRRKITEVSEDENVKNCQKESQKSSTEEAVERIKGDQLKNGFPGSVEQKSLKKERNISTEPRTANAFQRVKAEEVQFSDERLQNNSYWAKSGAEYGYGAKAQEVLGQVKGRDFRHEKTKKKRGSYRGGQIDFGAHSVKFNYSEEE